VALKGIKRLPSKRPSIMAISKLLHFFNPNLFLIYDNMFIEEGLLRVFRTEWNTFSEYPKAEDELFNKYLKYLYFANRLLRGKVQALRRATEAHLKRVAPQHNSIKLFRKHALIFEFLALGAVHREKTPPAQRRT
jgi:hypothetical protein